VKVIVRRRRPPREGQLTTTYSDLSYPSAHAATSVAGARRLAETLPAAPLWALAVALAASRLYLRVHHPTDVAAGAALGGAVAELTS
jgi:membrane-associated phospholipid phosphatase